MARRPTNHARHAALSRLHKRTLLPLPQKAVDAMALEYHAALAALASGHGSTHGVELLQQLVVIARFIGETSGTRLDPTLLDQLTGALQATLERGTATGEWLIDARGPRALRGAGERARAPATRYADRQLGEGGRSREALRDGLSGQGGVGRRSRQ